MRLLATFAVLFVTAVVLGDEKPADTPMAAKTRKLLKKKISVEFKDTRLEDVVSEIKEEVKGLFIQLDAKGGVSKNRTVTYKAKDKTVEDILDEVFKKMGNLGYIVISKKGNAYDGNIQVRVGTERGYEKKKE